MFEKHMQFSIHFGSIEAILRATGVLWSTRCPGLINQPLLGVLVVEKHTQNQIIYWVWICI